MIIEKHTICYTSEIGHNNFWYPSHEKLLIKKGASAQIMSWVSGGTKIPLRVLKSSLLPLNLTEKTTLNISPPTKNDYTVVWIEKCLKK